MLRDWSGPWGSFTQCQAASHVFPENLAISLKLFYSSPLQQNDFFLQSFVPIVNLDSKLIRIQSCVHNTLSRTQL